MSHRDLEHDRSQSISLPGRCLKGKGKGETRNAKREKRARREGVSLPPSSRAPRVSLAPKTPFPFPFKRLPRRLAVYMGRDFDWTGLDGGAPKCLRSFALTRKNLHLDSRDYQINYVNIDLRHQ